VNLGRVRSLTRTGKVIALSLPSGRGLQPPADRLFPLLYENQKPLQERAHFTGYRARCSAELKSVPCVGARLAEEKSSIASGLVDLGMNIASMVADCGGRGPHCSRASLRLVQLSLQRYGVSFCFRGRRSPPGRQTAAVSIVHPIRFLQSGIR
jgi:hypothetical protein